jgi:hypothetical protein
MPVSAELARLLLPLVRDKYEEASKRKSKKTNHGNRPRDGNDLPESPKDENDNEEKKDKEDDGDDQGGQCLATLSSTILNAMLEIFLELGEHNFS